jgi:2-(1,2-epoxy-1,2-dihydrophenyl)acetyl-CoA isomerase
LSLASVESKEIVLVRKENGVGWITLNRPEVLNACDIDTLKKLQSVLKQMETDPEVRCLVITGSGRAFCAGADLKSLKRRGSETKVSVSSDLRDGFNPVLSKIRNMDKPVIGMINGVAAGGGLGIALSCDIRMMSESAKFIEAFVKVGLVPDCGASYTMPRLLGLSKALELAFTGDGIDAREAERLGVVSQALPPDKLEQETRALAEKIASGPRAVGLSKRTIYKALSLDFDGALENEAYMQEIASSTHDHEEGLAAFVENRTPKFKGD